MTISDKINQYCINNSTKFNTKPRNFTCILSNKVIVIEATWPIKEPPASELITHPNKEVFELHKSEEIYNLLHNTLSQLKSNITIPNNGIINNVSICNKSTNKFQNSEYISSINMIIIPPELKSITETIHKELTKIEPNIKKEQIVEIKCSFKNSTLHSIEGYIVTENPHKYNKNMNSLDDYISINSHTKSKEELRQQDNYLTHFMIDTKIENNIESIMKKQMENSITISGKYTLQPESIKLTDYNSYPKHKPNKSTTNKINFSVIQPNN